MKIRCRKRRTSRSAWSQSTWSQSKRSSSGPFTATGVAASNLPIGSNAVVIATSTDSPDPRQRPFGPGQASLSGRLFETTSGSLAMLSRFPVAFRLPAFASRVIPSPLGTSAFLTVSPPTTTTAVSDPIGIATFRICKMRPDWVPSRPRGGGAHPARSTLSAGACRFTTASPARPASTSHLRTSTMTRQHRGFTHVHPPGLSLTRSPRMERGPFGLNPGLRTPRSPTTHAKAGTGHRARTWATSPSLASHQHSHLPYATSCHTTEFVPFLDYDLEIRKVICSTNAIWVLYLPGWVGLCFPDQSWKRPALTLNAIDAAWLSWIRSVGLAV